MKKDKGRKQKEGDKSRQLSSFILRPPSSGFTLVEIIIVLFIIGIASGLVGIWISRGSGNLEIRNL
jgi:prepilin-type N-terminal cleavage/methylation domain-containing protein